jgi:hypothetical protein
MNKTHSYHFSLYKFILVCVGSYKLIESFESVPEFQRVLKAMNVKFLAQGNNNLPLTGFEPISFSTVERNFNS